MALSDDLAAIDADTNLTDAERRAARYAVKVNGLVTRLSSFVGNSWNLNGVNYRLNAIRSEVVRGIQVLTIDLTRTATGLVFAPQDVLRITNPPLVNAGKAIDGMTNQERLDYVKALVALLPPGVPV